jgi:hypothetical protein
VLIGGVVVISLRRMPAGGAPAALAVAALAYVVQQQLLFPIAEIDPLLWLVAGSLLAVPAAVSPPVRVTAPRRPAHLAAAGCAAAATAVLFGSGVVGVAADRAAAEAVDRQSLAAAERAVELRPDVVRYHLLVAALATASGTLAGAQQAIDATEAALDVSPADPIAAGAAAQARLHRAQITGTPHDVQLALVAWSQVVDDDPLCRSCQFGLGMAAALAGDAELAGQAWRAADGLSRPGDDRAKLALAELATTEDTTS